MKRIIGIVGVLLVAMLLGMSLGWAESAGVTLVSSEPSTLIGD